MSSTKSFSLKYAIFDSDDNYVPIGKFFTEEDAEIAMAEHGLNDECEEYYVSGFQYFMRDKNPMRVTIEPVSPNYNLDCQCHEYHAYGLPCIQCQLDADIALGDVSCG